MDQGLLKLVSAPSARDGGGGGGGRRGGDGGAGGGMQLPPHSLSSGLDSVDEVQEEKEEDERGAEELEEELRHRMAALALALASCPNAADAQDADPHMHGSGAIDSPAPFAHDISCSGANCVPLFFFCCFLFFSCCCLLLFGSSRSLMLPLFAHAPTQWSFRVKHALPRLREKDARRCW